MFFYYVASSILPRDFREKPKRNKINKVNKLIREKCSLISTSRINHIEQDHDWIDEGKCLRIKYYHRDCLPLVELGNKTFINTIKHSNLTMSMNTSKYKATTTWSFFKKRGLHFVYLNINSLSSKKDKLRQMAKVTNSAVIGLSEAKLDKKNI